MLTHRPRTQRRPATPAVIAGTLLLLALVASPRTLSTARALQGLPDAPRLPNLCAELPVVTSVERIAWEVGRPIHAIASRAVDDVWAVGGEGTMAHYNGTSWSIAPAIVSDTLRAVALREDGTGMAVGDAGSVLRLDGQGWRAASSPHASASLSAVTSTPDGVWLVTGNAPGEEGGPGFLWHTDDAGAWAGLPAGRLIPPYVLGGRGFWIHDLVLTSPTTAQIVGGGTTSPDQGHIQADIGLTQIPEDPSVRVAEGFVGALRAIAFSPARDGGVLTASIGDAFEGVVRTRSRGARRTVGLSVLDPSSTHSHLNDVSRASDGYFIAVGDDDLVAVFSHELLRTHTLDTRGDLLAVDARDGVAWIGGTYGRLLRLTYAWDDRPPSACSAYMPVGWR